MLGSRLKLTAMTITSSLLSFASYTLLLKYSADTRSVDEVFLAGSFPLAVSGTVSGVLLYLVPARLNQINDSLQQLTIAALGVLSVLLSTLLCAGFLVHAIFWEQSAFNAMVTAFVLTGGVSVLSTIGLCFGQARASYLASGKAPLAAAVGLLVGSVLAIATQQPWMIVFGQLSGSLLCLWFSATAWRQRSRTESYKFSLAGGFRSVSALRHHLLPVASATLAFTVFQPIDAHVCAQLSTGCLSIISYSQKIVMALGTAISLGAYIVAAKTSREAFLAGGLPGAKVLANREIRRILVLGLVVWGMFKMFGPVLILELFKRSEFDSDEIVILLDCIRTMLIGVGAMAAVPFLFRVLYSVEEYRIPAYVGLAVPVSYAAIALIFVPKLGTTSLAVSFAIVWWLAFFASWLALNLKRHNPY